MTTAEPVGQPIPGAALIWTSPDGDGDWTLLRRIPGAGSVEVGHLHPTPRGFETFVGRHYLGMFATDDIAKTAVAIYLGV